MRNQSQKNSVVARLGDAVLSLLAIGGGISIVLVILAITLNVSIMMFRTGSMEPSIPTGSIAFVREIPATEMAEGDVITVDRGEDLLPVTHRVTDIQHVDPSSSAVTFIMRGDANETDDPEPYTASTVQRTMFSIPGVAPAIQSLQNPLVLGGLTLGASALVIWAFWPRSKSRTTARVQRPRGAHAASGLALPLVLVLLIPTLQPSTMNTDETNLTTEQVAGEYLRLESAGDRDKMSTMVPGQPVTWAVDVWAQTPEPGQIELDVAAAGQLDAIATEVVLCTPHPDFFLQCDPDAERHVVDTTNLGQTDSVLKLGSMSSEDTLRILITAMLSTTPAADVEHASAAFQVIATGAHERLLVGSGPELTKDTAEATSSPFGLADTGVGAVWLVALAAVLTIAGIILLVRRATSNRFAVQRGACCA